MLENYKGIKVHHQEEEFYTAEVKELPKLLELGKPDLLITDEWLNLLFIIDGIHIDVSMKHGLVGIIGDYDHINSVVK